MLKSDNSFSFPVMFWISDLKDKRPLIKNSRYLKVKKKKKTLNLLTILVRILIFNLNNAAQVVFKAVKNKHFVAVESCSGTLSNVF